jgi:hypothetical protein
MAYNKIEIKEERYNQTYYIPDDKGKEKSFTPEVIYRDGKFSHFTLHKENEFKTKYTLQLDQEDEVIFNVLKDFFKSID